MDRKLKVIINMCKVSMVLGPIGILLGFYFILNGNTDFGVVLGIGSSLDTVFSYLFLIGYKKW